MSSPRGSQASDPVAETIHASPQTQPGHECSICHKRYERSDHLKRHVASHQNSRPHACHRCSRRFNRKDLLTRHLANHNPEGGDNGDGSTGLERALQACEPCVLAKTKCSNHRPCRRCQTRGVSCRDSASKKTGNLPAAPASAPTQEPSPSATTPQAPGTSPRPDASESAAIHGSMDLDPVFDPLDLAQDGRVMEQATLPVPFEAMDPAMMSEPLWENLNIPSGVFHFYQDVDFLFDDTFHNLPPEHKHGYQQGRLTQHLPGNNARNEHILEGSPPPDLSQATPTSIQSDTHVPGYEAFQKSPWLWAPVRQDHAYAESQQLSINEAQLMETSEVEETARVSPRMPKMAHASTRDEILSLALKFSQSNLKIRSFPSFNLLNILIQAFFVRQSTLIDAWIHVASFDPDQCHSELLGGVVAAGSTLFAVPNVWKMGLALQEIVRLATCDAIDRDNRRARDLQSIQSFVLWGDIGLWGGFRRKMEIGEGFAHTVPTMLRRAGAFRRNYYPPIETPTADDDEDVLRKKWLAWVEQQSFKKPVLQVFINDMRSSIAFNRNPILSPVEMTFTLPAPRDLWDARDPFEWRARYLSKPNRQVTISLVDGMQNPSKLDSEIELIDIELSTHAILYGLWGRVHSFFDAKAFALRDSSSAPRSTSNLWVEAQRQDLQQKIRAAHTKLGWIYPLSAEADLIGNFLLMSLHVSSDDIQAFAGRYGEEELRQAIPRLREWGHSEDKYSTLWHAGQVLKAARSYPPTLLRGFHAIAVYHACLSLWISSIISSKEPSSASQVVLDGDETPGIQRFIATGHGRPCLHVGDGIGELEDPLIISVVLLEVFTKNFPSRSHPIPPLLENLVSLMGDISRVQTRIPG